MAYHTISTDTERAILVGITPTTARRAAVSESLAELARLATTAGAEVLAERIQVRAKPSPATYVGSGFVTQLKDELAALGGNTVIFDDPLSPAQQRNLEKALDAKVLDRSILILDIFATGARTAESRLQVELAQLEYTLPRLTGAWVHFSKQYGGIGAKGPGETQLEIDRRQTRKRISYLRSKLKKVATARATQRKRRRDLFRVALVGYTNAGKSTLFNLLTRADVETADKLFTTLDSTTRAMAVDYPCRIIFSDTVGFIRKLPHQLVESFHSTLEEVAEADLLLHVVDCTDEDLDATIEQTRRVLAEIGARDLPTVMVYNKIDAFAEFRVPAANGHRQLAISAQERTGIDAVRQEILASAGQRAIPRPIES